jgi:hypothetical protein
MNGGQQQRQATSARTMEEYMRMRQRHTPTESQNAHAGRPGRGHPGAQVQQKHKLYVATGNDNCTKACSFINEKYSMETGVKVTKRNAFKTVVEVINITKHPHLKPPSLKGVPCFLEFSAKTGQWRPHYGTAAINAMKFLASNLPQDEVTVADMTNGYNSASGFAIDDTYEYDDLTPEQAESVQRDPKDLDSYASARARLDQKLQGRTQKNVDFTEPLQSDDVNSCRGMSMEQLQAARSRLPQPKQ